MDRLGARGKREKGVSDKKVSRGGWQWWEYWDYGVRDG